MIPLGIWPVNLLVDERFQECLEIRLGLSMPMNETVLGSITWENTAPAIDIAIERIRAEGLIPHVNFR